MTDRKQDMFCTALKLPAAPPADREQNPSVMDEIQQATNNPNLSPPPTVNNTISPALPPSPCISPSLVPVPPCTPLHYEVVAIKLITEIMRLKCFNDPWLITTANTPCRREDGTQ